MQKKVCDCNDLKLEIEAKNNTIKNLEDELKSYKLALEILTKEFGKTNTTVVSDAPEPGFMQGVESEKASCQFKVVKRKTPKKTNTYENRDTFKSTSKEPTKSQNRNSRSNKSQDVERKSVLILGDSILKQVEGWKLGQSTKTRTKVKCFLGACVNECYAYDYFKPPLKSNPDEVIVHVGTNDLKAKSASK